MGQNLVEKLATSHVINLGEGSLVYAGDFVNICPNHVMTHDNTSAVMEKFQSVGAKKIAHPRQPVFAIDHDIQNHSEANLAKYARIEAFAHKHGVDFYPAGTGISHQVMIEYGYVTPGSMVVGSDSHSNIYGGAAALGTPVVRSDAVSIWATGKTWWQVPQVARVSLRGQLRAGVVGKDVIIALCGLFNQDEVLNMAVEFVGDGIPGLSMDQRFSISNMTTEWGALAGVFPFDDCLKTFLDQRVSFMESIGSVRFTRDDVEQWAVETPRADEDAHYCVDLELDLSTVIPHVSGPDHVKRMRPLPEIERERVAIQKAYLVSCVNARDEDLAAAAEIVKGKHIADGVSFYIAAASIHVQRKAEGSKVWKTLLDSGAIPLPPGCGPCIGLGEGTLEPGEVAISATNRNFKGRMGSRDAVTYLASPTIVAASALAGYIRSPEPFTVEELRSSMTIHGPAKRSSAPTEIVEGFPSRVNGRALWLDVDNLNTDGIYSGALTYKDDVSPRDMAEASMANYDPEFHRIARHGDVIVSGKNFGTGSSREQAVTCLKHLGIVAVVAYSFSETYKRNALNNGFVALECPEFIDVLRTRHPTKVATLVAFSVEIAYDQSMIRYDRDVYPIVPLSPVAQALVLAGGAEAMLRRELQGDS